MEPRGDDSETTKLLNLNSIYSAVCHCTELDSQMDPHEIKL